MPAHELGAQRHQLCDFDIAVGHALDGDPPVDDLEVFGRRFQLLGRDLQQLPPRLQGGFPDRTPDAVCDLAAGRHRALRCEGGVANDDANLLGRDSKRVGGDQCETGRGATDVG